MTPFLMNNNGLFVVQNIGVSFTRRMSFEKCAAAPLKASLQRDNGSQQLCAPPRYNTTVLPFPQTLQNCQQGLSRKILVSVSSLCWPGCKSLDILISPDFFSTLRTLTVLSHQTALQTIDQSMRDYNYPRTP